MARNPGTVPKPSMVLQKGFATGKFSLINEHLTEGESSAIASSLEHINLLNNVLFSNNGLGDK